MILSASSYNSMLYYDDPYHYFKRQLMWSVVGLISMFVVMQIDYNKYKKYIKTGFFLSVILLVMVLIPGVGKEVKGSIRWIEIGSLGFAPSEIVKISIVFFFAYIISRKPKDIKTIKGFASYLFVLGVVGGLLLSQPDLGTTIVIFATVFCVFIAAGAK